MLLARDMAMNMTLLHFNSAEYIKSTGLRKPDSGQGKPKGIRRKFKPLKFK